MALHFPKSFGHNWDALEECLVDLDMDSDGFVILYDHIDGLLEAHPDQFETLVEVLRDAVGSWKEDGMAMAVLLSGAKAPKGVGKLKESAAEDWADDRDALLDADFAGRHARPDRPRPRRPPRALRASVLPYSGSIASAGRTSVTSSRCTQ